MIYPTRPINRVRRLPTALTLFVRRKNAFLQNEVLTWARTANDQKTISSDRNQPKRSGSGTGGRIDCSHTFQIRAAGRKRKYQLVNQTTECRNLDPATPGPTRPRRRRREAIERAMQASLREQ
jgi:hypothetical protein